MYERFTDRARKVMQLANQEAQRFNHEYIGTEHLLLGLVKEGAGVAANVLKSLDIDLRKVRLEVEKIVQSGPDKVTMGRLPQTPRAKKVIEYSIEEARNIGHNYVGTEHLLLGLVRETEGVAAQVLMNLGVTLEALRAEVAALLGHEPRHTACPESENHLEACTRPLDGPMRIVIGREQEVDRICELLLCRTRPNILLVGETGVGKTTLLLELQRQLKSLRIDVYLRLIDWNLLDALITTEKTTGRLKRITARPNRILCVDPLSSPVHLKNPAAARLLSEREIRCLATCTPASLQDLKTHHPDIANRFTIVPLREPNAETIVEILKHAKLELERHHHVRVEDDAMHAAVEWADQFDTNLAQPARSMQLFDLACARTVLQTGMSAEAIQEKLLGVSPDRADRIAELQALLDEARERNGGSVRRDMVGAVAKRGRGVQ